MFIGMFLQHGKVVFSRCAASKSRYFDCFMAAHDMHKPETATNDARASENLAHFLWCGIRGDVKVFWLQAQYQVTCRAANYESRVSGLLKARGNVQRAFIDVVASDAMFLPWDNIGAGRRIREEADGDLLRLKTRRRSLLIMRLGTSEQARGRLFQGSVKGAIKPKLYTRPAVHRDEMSHAAHVDFTHGAAVKCFKIDAIKHLCSGTCYHRTILEQHENVVAEPAGPTYIMEHHHNRSSLPGQFMKQRKGG